MVRVVAVRGERTADAPPAKGPVVARGERRGGDVGWTSIPGAGACAPAAVFPLRCGGVRRGGAGSAATSAPGAVRAGAGVYVAGGRARRVRESSV